MSLRFGLSTGFACTHWPSAAARWETSDLPQRWADRYHFPTRTQLLGDTWQNSSIRFRKRTITFASTGRASPRSAWSRHGLGRGGQRDRGREGAAVWRVAALPALDRDVARGPLLCGQVRLEVRRRDGRPLPCIRGLLAAADDVSRARDEGAGVQDAHRQQRVRRVESAVRQGRHDGHRGPDQLVGRQPADRQER